MEKRKMELQLFGDMEDEAVDGLMELAEEYQGMNAEQQVEVAKIAQLRRIASALEGIENALSSLSGIESSLEDLAGCAVWCPSPFPGGKPYKMFRIGGSVSADF